MGSNLGGLSVITNHPRAHLHSACASCHHTQTRFVCVYIYRPGAGLVNGDRYSTGGGEFVQIPVQRGRRWGQSQWELAQMPSADTAAGPGKNSPLESSSGGCLGERWGGSSPLVNAVIFSLGDADLLLVSSVSPKQSPYLWQNLEEDKGGKGDFVCGTYLFIYLFIAAWKEEIKLDFKWGCCSNGGR